MTTEDSTYFKCLYLELGSFSVLAAASPLQSLYSRLTAFTTALAEAGKATVWSEWSGTFSLAANFAAEARVWLAASRLQTLEEETRPHPPECRGLGGKLIWQEVKETWPSHLRSL